MRQTAADEVNVSLMGATCNAERELEYKDGAISGVITISTPFMGTISATIELTRISDVNTE